MDHDKIISDLKEFGYCVIPNVLNEKEIEIARNYFFDWKNKIPNIDYIHNIIDPHGIFKFHQIGHQKHAWYLRTRPQIIDIFKKIWNTDELVVSFDGCCYLTKECRKKNSIWTHVDQPSNNSELLCYQSFVSLTDNSEKTLIVYEKSHLYHKEYFANKNKSSKRWNLIDHETLNKIETEGIHDIKKRVLKVDKGSLVIWDSRCFHQNQYGAENNKEERLVQYLCYLKKNHKDNNKAEQHKRLKYYLERRTTSHWPYKINVNSLQPQTYGNSDRQLDYSKLPKICLEAEPFYSQIRELI